MIQSEQCIVAYYMYIDDRYALVFSLKKLCAWFTQQENLLKGTPRKEASRVLLIGMKHRRDSGIFLSIYGQVCVKT